MHEKTSRHHILPISISWPDIPQNIASISHQKHEELHRILDMNSRLHYTLVRKAREKTNHKMILNPDDLEYRHEAQRLYFERLPRLDWFLRKVHLEKMNQLVWYEVERLEKIWIIEEVVMEKDFNEALAKYHNYQKNLALEICNIFKKWFILNNQAWV